MKTVLIFAAVVFVLYYMYEHLSIQVVSDFDIVNQAAKLPQSVTLKDLVQQISTPGTQKLIRLSVAFV